MHFTPAAGFSLTKSVASAVGLCAVGCRLVLIRMKNVYLLLLLLLWVSPVWAQHRLTGRITEAENGAPIPFASIFVPGTTTGTTADENGQYQLSLAQLPDTIAASAIGFTTLKKALGAVAGAKTLNFALPGGGVTLGEVTVRPRENPAYAIMRQVQAHKARNNKQSLAAFEFSSYNRVEVSLNNLPKQLTRQRLLRDIASMTDSLGQERDANGKPMLPLFASEMLSRYYVLNEPLRRREEIQHSQLRGMAPREGSILSQVMGASFQDWDFYRNWQQLLGKDFISPIADGWKFTYEYELQDSVWMGKDWCYQLGVTPRRAQDLAFVGTIWVTAETYALRRLDLLVSPQANLNFADRVAVYQEMTPPAAGPGLPVRTRVLISLKPAGGQRTGVLAKFTTVNTDFDRNHPRPLAYYDRPLETASNAFQVPEGFWEQNRPDTLSVVEQRTLVALDSVRELPGVRRMMKLANVASTGYLRVGLLDLGPLISSYSFNSIEGSRFRFGFRTTPELSPDWLVRAYAAYGTRDTRLKYGARVSRILDRDKWTMVTVEHRDDLDQIALLDNDYAVENPLFEASARLGNITSSRPVRRNQSSVAVQSDLFRGFTQRLTVRQQNFTPLYPFAYYTEDRQPGAPTAERFSLSEAIIESRYARDEVMVQSQTQNFRYPMGLKRWPVFTLRYTIGLDNLLGSDFRYHKFNFLISQSVQLGQLGRTDYTLDAGYIPSTVPYPILKTHLGNQSPFYNAGAFNLMRYFEFVSDRYVAFRFENRFEGFLLNSLPLLKKLNWRLLATGNVLYGSVSAANRAITPPLELDGQPIPAFQSLGRLPYAEVGYGVENIFKIVRVDFLHRLTYRNLPEARNFGVKVSFQFRL